jgi:hypothetical protein
MTTPLSRKPVTGQPITGEYFETGSKKPGRGMAQRSLDLIEAMATIAEAVQPVTGRGVGYKLFTAGLIPSMATSDMARVYRLLRIAREEGLIPWEWIVDETRSLERRASWSDPEAFARSAAAQYRRDFWELQPRRCVVGSEKGTVRGVLMPILDELGVGFQVMHGFGAATTAHDLALSRDLSLLYVGDIDPSGMYMSEVDLPSRINERYGGHHVSVKRIAITEDDTIGLPSFPAKDKEKDPRYKWFVANYGDRCWELDAMDPNELRERVREEIVALIDPNAWNRCAAVNEAEQESLRTVLDQWAVRQ